MDRDHRLDTPDNESLRTIRQLEDRSDLSTLYPNQQVEWKGMPLLSQQERYAKRDAEQRAITTGLRVRFVAIGLLTPLPFIAALILLSAFYTASEYISFEALRIVPAILTAVVWAWISIRGWRTLFKIFYKHAVRGLPLVFLLLIQLALVGWILYSFTAPFFSNWVFGNLLGISIGLFAISTLLSGALVFIWTSYRLGASIKIALIIALTLVLAAGAVLISLPR